MLAVGLVLDDTNHYLIHEVLDELIFDSFRFQYCVKVGSHKFGHKVSKVISILNSREEVWCVSLFVHVFRGRNKDVGQVDDLAEN